uniref:Anoctamin n=1 Tax=Pelodiscus sinensis TaxID=13735 RepID=K7G2D4_PELSI
PADFVLVWEEKLRPPKKKRRRKLPCPEASGDRPGGRHERWQRKFLNNLRNAGLLMEKEETLSERKSIHYLKLSAPWDVLVYYAEELCLRAPLQSSLGQAPEAAETPGPRTPVPGSTLVTLPSPGPSALACFLCRFLGSDSRDSYFTHTQRQRIVYEILARTVYGKRKCAEIGIDRLLNEGVYAAAFPLHEGPFEMPECEASAEALNPRQVLYRFWARWGCWCRYQPLDHVREYFGEKIAIYFAWLGFYTAWLLPAAAVGTVVFLAGLVTMGTNTPAQEICESGGQFLMCPLCDTCQTWNISEICPMAKVGYLFDHPGTVFFSVFMSFWAVTFLEHWKRKSATLAAGGGRCGCQAPALLPEGAGNETCPSSSQSSLQSPWQGPSGQKCPAGNALKRHLRSSCLLEISLCVVMIFLVSVIMYRGIVSVVMYHTGNAVLMTQAGNIANISSTLVNLALILLMSQVYTSLAEKLTRWEMHRTQTLHEDAFTFKVFIFQFVNFYSSPFYVAFFKGRFVGYPGQYGTLLGLRNEECGPGGCLIELAQQLFIIMVGKQIVSNIQEFVIPCLFSDWQRQAEGLAAEGPAGQEPPRWEEDYELIDCEGLFEEYLEMVLQFGFITIFVAACPLAPLFALLNNWVEIRLDAQKFVCEYRRPVAYRAQNLRHRQHSWEPLLTLWKQTKTSCTAFLIAFTSDFLPRLLYRYEHDSQLQGFVNFTLAYSPPGYMATNHTLCRYKAFRDANGNYTLFYWKLLAIRLGFIIAFEHVVFFFLRLIDWLVPDIPESLELKIKRERYLAKQALADNQEVLLTVSHNSASPGPMSVPAVNLQPA